MRFVAIDVETANSDMSSICQIGIAEFVNGRISNEWESLIDPEDDFDFFNVKIHGITEETVAGAPTLPQTAPIINSFLTGQISVCHTHFDRVSLSQAMEKYGLTGPDTTWLDSARVARRTWQECAWKGYGLSNVCELIGYRFTHHNALEDAKACGEVLLAATAHTGLTLQDWLVRVEKPIDPSTMSRGAALKRDGNPNGWLYGEVLVFTGALRVHRAEAADMAAEMGCRVSPNVNKMTTILVVGDQDVSRLAGHSKSNKHRKAEELIAKGQAIRIIRETDFLELARFKAT